MDIIEAFPADLNYTLLGFLPSHELVFFRLVSTAWCACIDKIITLRISPEATTSFPGSWISSWCSRTYTARTFKVQARNEEGELRSPIEHQGTQTWGGTVSFKVAGTQIYSSTSDGWELDLKPVGVIPGDSPDDLWYKSPALQKYPEIFRSGRKTMVSDELIEAFDPLLPASEHWSEEYHVLSSFMVPQLSTYNRFANAWIRMDYSAGIHAGNVYTPVTSNEEANVFFFPCSDPPLEKIKFYEKKFVEDPDYTPTVVVFGSFQRLRFMGYILDGHAKMVAALNTHSPVQVLIFASYAGWAKVRSFFDIPELHGREIRKNEKSYKKVTLNDDSDDSVNQLLNDPLKKDLVFLTPQKSRIRTLVGSYLKEFVNYSHPNLCQVVVVGSQEFRAEMKQKFDELGMAYSPPDDPGIVAKAAITLSTWDNWWDIPNEKNVEASKMMTLLLTDDMATGRWLTQWPIRRILLSTWTGYSKWGLAHDYIACHTALDPRQPRIFFISVIEEDWDTVVRACVKKSPEDQSRFGLLTLQVGEWSSVALHFPNSPFHVGEEEELLFVHPDTLGAPNSKISFKNLTKVFEKISLSTPADRPIPPIVLFWHPCCSHQTDPADPRHASLLQKMERLTPNEFSDHFDTFSKTNAWPEFIPNPLHKIPYKKNTTAPHFYTIGDISDPEKILGLGFDTRPGCALIDDSHLPRALATAKLQKVLSSIEAWKKIGDFPVIDSDATLKQFLDLPFRPNFFVILASLFHPSICPKVVLLSDPSVASEFEYLIETLPEDRSVPLVLTNVSGFNACITAIKKVFQLEVKSVTVDEFLKDEVVFQDTGVWPTLPEGESEDDGMFDLF